MSAKDRSLASSSTARLALLIAFIGGCSTSVTTHTPAAPVATSPASAAALPFGLSCDRCLPPDKERCERAERAPIAAVVAQAQLMRSSQRCWPDPPGPHFPSVCSASHLYRFGALEYLRKTPGATSADEFETQLIYDEAYTSNLENVPAAGPVLRPDGRYVIFAVADRHDIGLPADWYVNLACELQESDRPGAMR